MSYILLEKNLETEATTAVQIFYNYDNAIMLMENLMNIYEEQRSYKIIETGPKFREIK